MKLHANLRRLLATITAFSRFLSLHETSRDYREIKAGLLGLNRGSARSNILTVRSLNERLRRMNRPLSSRAWLVWAAVALMSTYQAIDIPDWTGAAPAGRYGPIVCDYCAEARDDYPTPDKRGDGIGAWPQKERARPAPSDHSR